MTDFCSANTERITDSNYNQSYSSTGKTSCLPNGGSGFSSTQNGVVDTATVDAHIVNLLSNALSNSSVRVVLPESLTIALVALT